MWNSHAKVNVPKFQQMGTSPTLALFSTADIEGVKGFVCYWVYIYILWVLWVMSRQRAECVHFISFLFPPVLPKKHSEIHRIECSGLKISGWLGGKPRFVVFHAISDIIVQAMALILVAKTAVSRSQADYKAHKFVCLVLPSLWIPTLSFFSLSNITEETNFEHRRWPDFCRWPPCPSERTWALLSYKDPRFPLSKASRKDLSVAPWQMFMEFSLELGPKISKSQQKANFILKL